jgi:hypothetical protein
VLITIAFCAENLEGNAIWKNERIILKLTFRKYDCNMWGGIIWFRIVSRARRGGVL